MNLGYLSSLITAKITGTIIINIILINTCVNAAVFTKISASKRWIGIYDNSRVYSWREAESYCNANYDTSLASYHTSNDEIEVSRTRYDYSLRAWIGLTDENNESGGNANGGIGSGWEWSDGSCYNYVVNWNDNEPNNVGSTGEDYAHLRAGADNINDVPGQSRFNSFVCNYVRFTISDIGYYTGVYSVDGYNFNWDESELFCNNYFDSHLASTTSMNEDEDASSARITDAFNVTNERTWVGLRYKFNPNVASSYLHWQWSDGTPYVPSQVSWAPGQPDYNHASYDQCVYLMEDSFGTDSDLYKNGNCIEELREFICNTGTCDLFNGTDSIFTKVSASERWISVYDNSNTYTWQEAELYCQREYGTSLAAYHNFNDEIEVSQSRYRYSQSAWIGLTDVNIEGDWRWSDGSCYNYEINWNNNEPNNQNNEDYATFRGNANNLNDLKSYSRSSQFICNYNLYITFNDTEYDDGCDDFDFGFNETTEEPTVSPVERPNRPLRDNNVDANYFIVNYNQNEFPMAPGTCNPFNVLGQGGYQMATCIDSNTIEYNVYADATCTIPVNRLQFNESTQTGTGTYLDFKCDGVDAYAAVEFAVATCDTNTKVTFHAALSTCALLTGLGTDRSEDYVSTQVYCEKDFAELYYFDTPGVSAANCSEDKLYQVANATDECGFIVETGDIPIFGEILDCFDGSEERTPEPTMSPVERPTRQPIDSNAPTVRDNNVDANYMIVNFNQNEFPMAPGTCNPFNVLGQGGYQMATCIDSNTLEYNTYGDARCSVPTTTTQFNESIQTGSGTYLDFKCDGVDAFAAIEFAVGTCDTNTKVTFHAAVSTCTLLTGLGTDPSDDYVSTQIYCEKDFAELYYFDSPDVVAADCSEDRLYQTANATDQCGFILKTGGTKIFGEVVECSAPRDGTTEQPTVQPIDGPTIYTRVSPSRRWISIYDSDNKYTWHEAEQYCQNEYGTSLASYHNYNDEIEVSKTRYLYSQDAWIGLNDENNESGKGNGGIGDGWEWSDGSCYNYEINWKKGEPNNEGFFNILGEDYVSFIGNKDKLNDLKWFTKLNSFICNYVRFTTSDVGYYIGAYSVAGYEFNWHESELYCNNFFNSHLASTTSRHEEADASSARISAANDRAWVGLKNEVSSIANAKWRWSDGTPYHSNKVTWSMHQPDYDFEQCVHFWEDSIRVDEYNNWICNKKLREFVCNEPQCDQIIEPTDAPTPEPTIQPTEEPTDSDDHGNDWVEPCFTDPCVCTFDDNCKVCHFGQGCSQCIGTNGEYFKLDWNYPCTKCNDVFGDSCEFCQDFNGCGQCKNGYIRTYDEKADLFYCKKEKSGKGDKKEKRKQKKCAKQFGDGCLDCNKQLGCTECDEDDGYKKITKNNGLRYCKKGFNPPISENIDSNMLDVNVNVNDKEVEDGSYSYSYSTVLMAFIGGILSAYVINIIYSRVKQFCIKTNAKLIENTEYQPLL